MIVQDNIREVYLADLFALQCSTSRIAVDASDELGNDYELKTTTKRVVSTARDLGPNHLARWRVRFWIVARGRNLSSGFNMERVFFLSRYHMESWYRTLDARFADEMAFHETVITRCPDLDQKRLRYKLHRSMLLNDPGISWNYVLTHGIEIHNQHAARLRELVAQYPLDFEPSYDFLTFPRDAA